MKLLRRCAIAVLAVWLALGTLAARLHVHAQGLSPFNFVSVAGTVRIAWNYPFEVMQALRMNNIRFADGFGSGDPGAKVMAAIADIPIGGTVDLCGFSGDNPYSTPIVIQKPIKLRGCGIGSTSVALTTATESTTLRYTGATGTGITISLPTFYLHDVILEGFTLIGNKSSGTSGTGIAIVGGNTSTQLTGVMVRDVNVRDFKGDNITISDNAFMVNFDHVWSSGGGQDCFHVFQTGLAGIPSQVRVHNSWFHNCARDGFRVETGYQGPIELTSVTSSNNGNDGVTAFSGALQVTYGDYEANTQLGIFVGAPLFNIIGANIPTNSNGIWLASGATWGTIIGLPASGNTNFDLNIQAGANFNRIISPNPTATISDAGTRNSFDSSELARNTQLKQLVMGSTLTFGSVAFASLPASSNGTTIYCSDCNATCTAGASTGRTCFRENGAWTH